MLHPLPVAIALSPDVRSAAPWLLDIVMACAPDAVPRPLNMAISSVAANLQLAKEMARVAPESGALARERHDDTIPEKSVDAETTNARSSCSE